MTALLADHTVLPPTDEALLPVVIEALNRNDHATLVTGDGSSLELPVEVYEALRDVVAAMAAGQAITIAPHNTVLTTQEAADLLNMSRPTLVRLLEGGQIAFTQPGRHRRVYLADVLAYQQRLREERRAVLDTMTKDAAEDDSYAKLNAFIKTR
ncbi:helix-turn-helix domain-containing protein [Paenarthrobacter sp. NPDC089989]|uniref:helix-turn-helix domain-containing protein n=1 Tax=unclassified Paenarthrobacter TaxID=2634190 RepID=UPI00381C26DC